MTFFEELKEIANRQAEDEGLWCEASTATEAYLQKSLRELHGAIEKDDNMDFGAALAHMKMGGGVAREGWNGRNQEIAIQKLHEGSDMTLPYIYITTVQGKFVPWLASQTDLLSDDWCVVSVILDNGRA